MKNEKNTPLNDDEFFRLVPAVKKAEDKRRNETDEIYTRFACYDTSLNRTCRLKITQTCVSPGDRHPLNVYEIDSARGVLPSKLGFYF